MATKTRPRKKKTTIEEEIPEGQTGFEEPATDFDVSLEGVQDTETLNDVLDQFGQRENVLFRIYKQTPNGNSFCYETLEYNVMFLQRQRGAGIYTVRIFINGKFKKSITEVVEAPSNDSGTGPGTGAPASGDSHSQFLEKLLLSMIANQQAGAGTAHGPSIIELTQALSNLDGLRGKQESAMDMFLKGVDLAKTMLDTSGGAGDWKSELLKMGRDAIPAITSVVQSRLQPVTPPPQEQPGHVMIDPEQMTDEQKKLLLKQTIVYLKSQFIAGLPPESALDFIVANSGNPQYQTIIKAVLAYSFEDIVGLDAEIQSEPFHTCFRTVYDGLRSEFGPEDTMDNDSGRDTGDASDVGSDGESRPTRK